MFQQWPLTTVMASPLPWFLLPEPNHTRANSSLWCESHCVLTPTSQPPPVRSDAIHKLAFHSFIIIFTNSFPRDRIGGWIVLPVPLVFPASTCLSRSWTNNDAAGMCTAAVLCMSDVHCHCSHSHLHHVEHSNTVARSTVTAVPAHDQRLSHESCACLTGFCQPAGIFGVSCHFF